MASWFFSGSDGGNLGKRLPGETGETTTTRKTFILKKTGFWFLALALSTMDPCVYLVHVYELTDSQREVARGEGLGQNPRSRRPAPVWQIKMSTFYKIFLFFNVLLFWVLFCLPINLARHFSRARLCWCFWCPIHPVGIRWSLTLKLLRLLFHLSGWAETIQDYVLVLFPVASLWVWSGCGITLKQNEQNLLLSQNAQRSRSYSLA